MFPTRFNDTLYEAFALCHVFLVALLLLSYPNYTLRPHTQQARYHHRTTIKHYNTSLLYGSYASLKAYNCSMSMIIFYTPVCMPCHNDEYHYYDIIHAIEKRHIKLDERLIKAVPEWEEQAKAFKVNLPILYDPDKNIYLSTHPYNKETIDQFLDKVNE